MTKKEIDKWVKIHSELFKNDKYMLECMKSHLDYLNATMDKE